MKDFFFSLPWPPCELFGSMGGCCRDVVEKSRRERYIVEHHRLYAFAMGRKESCDVSMKKILRLTSPICFPSTP